jgi:hypothetical protein
VGTRPGRAHSRTELSRLTRHVLTNRGRIGQLRYAGGAGESPAPNREIDTRHVLMHPCTTTWHPPAWIRDNNTLDHDNTEQLGGRHALPASNAGASRNGFHPRHIPATLDGPYTV